MAEPKRPRSSKPPGPKPPGPKPASGAKQAALMATAFVASEAETSTRVDMVPTKKRGIKMRVNRIELEAWEENPRLSRSEAELYDKGASLAEHGQLADLIVRPHPDAEKRKLRIYQVIDGVTRFLGGAPPYGDCPIYSVEVRDLNDIEALDVAFLANDKSAPMAPLDYAFYYRKRMRLENAGEDSLRLLAKKLELSKDRVKQFVDLLKLPGLKENGTIEPGSILGEFQRLGLNEKQGRALLMVQGELQLNLLRQMERAALSGTAAIEKARKMLDDEAKERDAENQPANNASGASATPSVTPVVTPGVTTETTGGTATTTPVTAPNAAGSGQGNGQGNGQGSGQTSGQSETTEGQDLATALLQPAVRSVAETARLWPGLQAESREGEALQKVRGALLDLEREIRGLKKILGGGRK